MEMAGGCRSRLEELVTSSVGVELAAVTSSIGVELAAVAETTASAAAAGARNGLESATAYEVSNLLRRTFRKSRTQPGRGVDHCGHTWRLAVAVAVAILLARLALDGAHGIADVVVGMRQSSVQDLVLQGSGGELETNV